MKIAMYGITDTVVLAQLAQFEAMRKLATPPAICTAIFESEGKAMMFDEVAERFFPGYASLQMIQKIPCMEVIYEPTYGFIHNPFANYNGVESSLKLTDAGVHLVTTSRLGPKAHSILSEIEAEMGGEA